jgi:hypothetical protein
MRTFCTKKKRDFLLNNFLNIFRGLHDIFIIFWHSTLIEESIFHFIVMVNVNECPRNTR